MASTGCVAATMTGMSLPARTGRRAASTLRTYCASRVFCPSLPWMRPLGERSLIVDLPTALAASFGRSGTFTVVVGRSAENLYQPHRIFRDRQHIGRMREGDGTDQGLEVKTIRYFNHLAQPVSQAVCAQGIRSGEDGQGYAPETARTPRHQQDHPDALAEPPAVACPFRSPEAAGSPPSRGWKA